MKNERHDILVIGAGIAGAASAINLQKLGRKVTLIDRRAPGEETSSGNAGVIGSGYVLPFGFPGLNRIPGILLGHDPMARARLVDLPRLLPWIIDYYFKSRPKPRRHGGELLHPLIAHAVEDYRALLQGTDAERYLTAAKQVSLYRHQKSFDDDIATREAARAMSVPFEVLSAEEFRIVEPNIKPVFHKAVRWMASAHLNNPGAVVAACAQRFVREGGTLMQSEVRALQPAPDDGWTVSTDHGGLHAACIVMCAGPWTLQLLKPLGYKFPLAVKRGYHRHFRLTSGEKLAHAITDVEWGYVLAPMEQGVRLTSGAEFAALGRPPNPIQVEQCLPHARELLPLGDATDAAPWLGNRPCFADSLPVVGPAPRHERLWFNFGHGHMGMTLGPATGRLLAELMCGRQPFTDPRPYRAGRFRC